MTISGWYRAERRATVVFASSSSRVMTGKLECVNHLDLVGWVNTARYKWAEIMGREIKFKPATFYLGITDHLARVVEGQEGTSHHQSFASGDTEGGDAERTEMEEIRQESERVEMAESLGKGVPKSANSTPSSESVSGPGKTSDADGQ